MVTPGLSASEAAGNTAVPVRYVNHHGTYCSTIAMVIYCCTIIHVHSVLCTSVVR